ncbi:unnamed protein product [Prunus brigantina]
MGVLINFWGREGERKRKRSRRGHQKQYDSFTTLCFSLPQPLLQVLHGGSVEVLQGTMCTSSTTLIINNSCTNVIPKTMILAFVVFRPTGSRNGDFGSTSRAAHFISAISGIWTTMVFLMCLEILLIFYTNVVELIAYGKPRKMGFYLFHIQTKEDKKLHDWEKIKA